MSELARSYGLSEAQVAEIHRAYLTSMIAAAERDGFVSEAEQALIEHTRRTLNVVDVDVPVVTGLPASASLVSGMRVCFTGTTVVGDVVYQRHTLESYAAQAGLQPVRSVTKRGCDLLVAADVASMSGKARAARRYGIVMMAATDFISALGLDPG